MMKPFFARNVFLFLGALLVLTGCSSETTQSDKLSITYPFNNAVFPAHIIAPLVNWEDDEEEAGEWEILVSMDEKEILGSKKAGSYLR